MRRNDAADTRPILVVVEPGSSLEAVGSALASFATADDDGFLAEAQTEWEEIQSARNHAAGGDDDTDS